MINGFKTSTGNDFRPYGFIVSRLRNHQRVGFHLSAIKDARALHAALLRIGNLLLAFGERDLQAETTGLLHLLFLHLRHALSGEIEPFTGTQDPVLWFVVRDRSLQSFFDQSISEQAVTELRGFERGLITLRRGENVHAFS